MREEPVITFSDWGTTFFQLPAWGFFGSISTTWLRGAIYVVWTSSLSPMLSITLYSATKSETTGIKGLLSLLRSFTYSALVLVAPSETEMIRNFSSSVV